jgi:hypothetical protein
MVHEYRNTAITQVPSADVKLLNDLCRIYSAENYCLRRIPRLVNLIENPALSELLSDHISKIMDRLNLLDDIFKRYNTRPSAFNTIQESPSHNLRIFLLKGDKGNKKLLLELIKASQYRYSLYELLLNTSFENLQSGISNMLMDSLKEEEKFYQDLVNIKRKLLAYNSSASVQFTE